MKLCNNCKITKSKDDFYTVNKRNKPTIYHICKPCCATLKSNMKDYYRNWELENDYGITLETYKQQSLLRDNKCDICSKQVKSLHVDHDHKTKVVRGYLCGSCNRGIGLLQDSPSIINKALENINKHV